ncbi:hypothetical protein [Priestia megaterium]|nr:hypothetical protein [Priestia megaterium]MED3941816.1 hypothetical protein [Priestia megaterium]MED4219682.1 hypothetical protein [Priestia megaterium]WEZ37835.1 hypothetical protein P5636_21960 [Priestia megaterium DSM 319]
MPNRLVEIEGFQNMRASPYTEEEEKWLDQVIEYCTVQKGIYNSNQYNGK